MQPWRLIQLGANVLYLSPQHYHRQAERAPTPLSTLLIFPPLFVRFFLQQIGIRKVSQILSSKFEFGTWMNFFKPQPYFSRDSVPLISANVGLIYLKSGSFFTCFFHVFICRCERVFWDLVNILNLHYSFCCIIVIKII